jgi:hypothetical protein
MRRDRRNLRSANAGRSRGTSVSIQAVIALVAAALCSCLRSATRPIRFPQGRLRVAAGATMSVQMSTEDRPYGTGWNPPAVGMNPVFIREQATRSPRSKSGSCGLSSLNGHPSSCTGSAANGPHPLNGGAIASWGSLAADPSSGIADRQDAGRHEEAGPAGPPTRLLRFLWSRCSRRNDREWLTDH